MPNRRNALLLIGHRQCRYARRGDLQLITHGRRTAMTKSIQTRSIKARLISGLIVTAAGMATRGSADALLLCAPYLRAQVSVFEPRNLRKALSETAIILQRLVAVLLTTFTILTGLQSGAQAECNAGSGTVINQANWRQYQDCFSAGIQYLWSQTGFYKMPDDAEIHVGQPHHYVLPQPFVAASEKFGGQARLTRQSDGSFRLENYTAGVPFPNPSGPDKALEIATNATYRMTGYAAAGFAGVGAGPAQYYSKDGRGNWSAETVDYVYRQLAYNWEPGVPQNDPRGAGAWSSEWVMVESPEQMRYTALLTIHYQDNLTNDNTWAFVPALRRSLRLPEGAKCLPLFGGDADNGDIGVGKYAAEFVREEPLLALVEMNPLFAGKFPEEYDGALGWPKPSWGDWETRKVYVVDLHKVSSLGADRCYGKRTVYLDQQYYQTLAEDIYDRGLQLAKVVWVALESGSLDQYSAQMGFGGAIDIYWDVQKEHASYISSIGRDPRPVAWNNQVPQQYQNVALYSSPGGLAQLMR
jgi:hypothetical protein